MRGFTQLKFIPIFLMGVLCISPATSIAQDNKALAALEKETCEPTKQPKDPSLWDKSMLLGLNLTSGNADTMLLNGRLAATRDYENNIWNFSLAGAYAEQDNDDGETQQTQEVVNAIANYKRVFDESYYGGFGTRFLYDGIADVDYRVFLKPALGTFLLRDDEFKLSVEAGPGMVFEEVGNISNEYFAPFVGQRVDWKISQTASLFETAEVMFDAEDADNYLVTAELGVEAAINSTLSLVVSVTNNYDGVPAEDKEKSDTVVGSALKVRL